MKNTLRLFLFFFLMAIQTVTAQQHDRYWLGGGADLDITESILLTGPCVSPETINRNCPALTKPCLRNFQELPGIR